MFMFRYGFIFHIQTSLPTQLRPPMFNSPYYNVQTDVTKKNVSKFVVHAGASLHLARTSLRDMKSENFQRILIDGTYMLIMLLKYSVQNFQFHKTQTIKERNLSQRAPRFPHLHLRLLIQFTCSRYGVRGKRRRIPSYINW